MNNEELNRAISALIEACPGPAAVNELHYAYCGAEVVSPSKAWQLSHMSTLTNSVWLPLDWAGDESASARLLEMMPEPDLWVESSKGEKRLWGCVPDIMQLEPESNPHYVLSYEYDRKLCIAKAAEAYLRFRADRMDQ